MTTAGQRRSERVAVALFAAVSYLPILLTRPGWVSADTKSYLTLDPGRLLSRAGSMWDPWVGAGTITHQNIGYLFPLGPYYWVMERLGSPDWLTQRLLWGTMVFAAAMGAWKLCRWLGWAVAPAAVTALTYALSLYIFNYLARMSVMLGSWAALPWLILYASLAVRQPGWRWPARFAVVVALVGSSNATVLLLAGIGPLVWVAVDLLSRRVTWRRTAIAMASTGALCLAVSLWWINGLRIQSRYGLPILRYTETYETVAEAATPTELLRGLGYWFFYGGDHLDRWVGPSPRYLSSSWLILLGFLIAALSIGGLFVAFNGRGRAVATLVVGLAVSAGAAPVGSTSPYGWLFERFTGTTSGMAMRSTPRAMPLVVLALAMGLGALAHAAPDLLRRIHRPTPRTRHFATGLAILLVAVQFWPWFTGQALTPSLLRREALPSYETDLVRHLGETGTARVYELPGTDFANYRWGGTVDPVLPGLIDRPYLAKEQVPQGAPATADLLNALERRYYEGWFEPQSLVPLTKLLGVGTVVTRNDLEYERYRLARPGQLAPLIDEALGSPSFAGTQIEDRPVIPMVDEQYYANRRVDSFPAVAAYDLDPDLALIATAPASTPTVIAGNGDGLVDLAAAGLLDNERAILPAAGDPEVVDAALDQPGAWLIVTDTNRKRGLRWSSIGSNQGALEPADSTPTGDPTDNRLDVFPQTGPEQHTVLETTGDLASVSASAYGNRFNYTTEDAAAHAVDGDLRTAWRGAVFAPSTGLHLDIVLRHPVTTDSITITQPLHGVTSRWITRLRVETDGVAREVDLDELSREPGGQRIDLGGSTTFTHLRLTVLGDNLGKRVSYIAQPGLGIAEVSIPGVEMGTTARLPTALAERATDAGQRLTMVMTRQRIDPATHNRTSPESAMQRRFLLAAERAFTVRGQARLAADADDALINAILAPTTIQATANRRLPGAAGRGAAAAIDGDGQTAWTTPFDEAVGSELTVVSPTPMGGQRWRLVTGLVPEYSAITAMSLVDGAGNVSPISLPARAGGAGEVTIPESVTTSMTLRIDAVQPEFVPDYFSGMPMERPAAVFEFRPADDTAAPAAGDPGFDHGCRQDLLAVDGQPLSIRLRGRPTTGRADQAMTVELCDAPALTLGPGWHDLETQPGYTTGVDLDRLILDAAAEAESDTTAALAIERIEDDHDRFRVTVGSSTDEQWLILRQSWNDGWEATLDGRSLGAPTLIDGYANGWLVGPGDAGRVVEIHWAPQRSVRITLWFSLLAGLGILVLALRRGTRAESGSIAPPAWWGRPVAIAAAVVALGVLGGWAAALGAVSIIAVPRRARPWLVLTAAGLIVAVGVYVAAAQWRRNYPPGADWPMNFLAASHVVWLAIGVLGGWLAAGSREQQLEMGRGDGVPGEVGGM